MSGLTPEHAELRVLEDLGPPLLPSMTVESVGGDGQDLA